MNTRMLIDATHPEETRVVTVDGNRLDDFDFESASKKQLKGNIYLARVTRVEPSLQAAFVEYGGNRHGFLAFSEIHPDYYRIPIEDRQALIAEEFGLEDDHDDLSDDVEEMEVPDEPEGSDDEDDQASDSDEEATSSESSDASEEIADDSSDSEPAQAASSDLVESVEEEVSESASDEAEASASSDEDDADDDGETEERPETVGGDAMEEVRRRRRPNHRRYKIQEVISRRQILLVQVVKEERGNKGAALTTYLSLAGRYCVLMPNTARGGGVSRKITHAGDRKRLKQVVEGLEVPKSMAVIVRTAGSERTKTEIKRDYEYLTRLWERIRETTLASTAPCLIHEEGNLIKRSIRDLYSRDINEVWVEGEEGYRLAKDFMKTLIPSHAKRVQPYRDPHIPLFHRFQVEGQLDAIHSTNVTLKSGGYIVMNQTEALVAIDVNSGRATSERNIEETALKTNLEAANEIARQLRLRDLAGLVVIDFIDMEENRNQNAVERRMKEAMKSDRARIQIGRISHFGLMELSRQRLRPSLFEASTQICPHCNGTGHVRSTESTALHVLRSIEEEGMRNRTAEASVHVAASISLYIINNKRDRLMEIEQRYGIKIFFEQDESLVPPDHKLERMRPKTNEERAAFRDAVAAATPGIPELDLEEEQEEEVEVEVEVEEEEANESRNGRSRRRRRRSGRKRSENAGSQETDAQGNDSGEDEESDGEESSSQRADSEESEDGEDGSRRRRRRGRRGGRRRGRRRPEENGASDGDGEGEASEAVASNVESDGQDGTDAEGAVADGADSSTAETVADAEAPQEAAPEAQAATLEAPDEVSEAVEEKPKKRRSRARKKPVEAEETASEEANPVEENPNAETETSAPEEGTEAVTEAVAEAEAEGQAEPEAKTEAEPEAEAEPHPAVQVQTIDKPVEKPKRGWWRF